jgi:hypothetical protein
MSAKTRAQSVFNGIIEETNIGLDILSRLTIGTKSFYLGCNPFIEFYGESPIGTKLPRYMMYLDSTGFLWIRAISADELRDILIFSAYVGANASEDICSFGGHLSPSALDIDVGSPWTGTLTRFRDIGADRYLFSGIIAALPAASVTYRGIIVRVQGGGGVADKLYCCMKAAAGTYSWVQVASG